MPVTSNGIPITMCTVVFAVLSVFMLYLTFSLSRGNSLLGPLHGRGLNLVTLAMGTFISAFLFFLGLNIDAPNLNFPYSVLLSFLQAIKTTGGGSTPSSLSAVKLSKLFCGESGHTCTASLLICQVIYFYHCILCIVAPASFVSVLVARMVHFLSLPLACFRALFRETYVFDELSEPNLTLAESIKDHARKEGSGKVNLVFTEAVNSADDSLHVRALDFGATCVQHSAEAVWIHLPLDKHIHIVLSSKNEEQNITKASAIRKACSTASKDWLPTIPNKLPIVRHLPFMRNAPEAWKCSSHMSIYAVTTLRGAESLFERTEIVSRANAEQRYRHVPVRCIDWTRNTSEKILRKYPLFLLGRQPEVPTGKAVPKGNDDERLGYLAWQKAMLKSPLRHVVVVGAGHVGMEFLRLALSTSRSCCPPDGEPLEYRFDVFDNKADAKHRDECQAKYRFISQVGNAQMLDELSCSFHLCDALGHDFLKELAAVNGQHGGITYIVVALGDDFITAQVSLRIRELFEGDELELLANEHQEEQGNGEMDPSRARGDVKTPSPHVDADGRRVPPIIVAVLDQAELCDALGQAKRDGFDYAIDTMGSPKDMYTYDLVFGSESGRGVETQAVSERKRRATRAKSLHRKYKLFAYVRSQPDCSEEIRNLAIDWCAVYDKDKPQARGSSTSTATKEFTAFQRASGNPTADHDHWLQRMERERRRIYSWAEGDNLIPGGSSQVRAVPSPSRRSSS